MLIVARYLEGHVVKGRTTDFHPENDSFLVDIDPGLPPERLPVKNMKALFFVRSLEGNPTRRDHREFPKGTGLRTKLWLEFRDGEKMAGWPVSAALGRKGFYVLPTDPDSNVEKAYVFRDSLSRILEGKAAESAARAAASARRISSEFAGIPRS